MLFIPIIMGLATLASAWLPEGRPSRATLKTFDTGTKKIRGVNAGSQYVVERWMVGDQVWKGVLQCGDTQSERECIEGPWNGNVDAASAKWKNHWDTWITQDDIQLMVDYGLNTIRIPVGFWLKEDLVEQEHFPKGGMKHLLQFCGWASDAGMYIIIDLHGLPGRQSDNSFTGDTTSQTLGFYQSDEEAERAYWFLEWMVENIHNDNNMRNVGAIELINEPKPQDDSPDTQWLVQNYYTSAVGRIRGKEEELAVSENERLDLVVMDSLWGSGPPAGNYVHDSALLFDSHSYYTDPIQRECNNDQSCALKKTCEGSRMSNDGEYSKFVGEWSLALNIPSEQNEPFYRTYFSAQQRQYEQTMGWIFWTWRAKNPDNSPNLLWSYKDSVSQGIIDKNLDYMLGQNQCG